MSSEIYYKRAYIKVRENFISLVQHGSSNAFEFSYSLSGKGREIAERKWVVNGMKSACTVEEYIEAGNTLFLFEYSAEKLSQYCPFRAAWRL